MAGWRFAPGPTARAAGRSCGPVVGRADASEEGNRPRRGGNPEGTWNRPRTQSNGGDECAGCEFPMRAAAPAQRSDIRQYFRASARALDRDELLATAALAAAGVSRDRARDLVLVDLP